MDLKFDRVELLLEARQTLRLTNAAGAQLHCVSGALWITQHRDRGDYFLAAGQSLRLDREGLTLVYAVEPAEFVLQEPAGRPSFAARAAAAARASLRATGAWIARHFGPEAIANRHLRGWYGAL